MSRTWVKRSVFIAIAVMAAILCVLFQPVNAKLKVNAQGAAPFERTTLQNQLFRLFDLGVTDINGDGQLDIFTSNHSNEQFVLFNEGQGKFSDNKITELHLNQDPEFPGLEYSLNNPPQLDKPGLYIYWKERWLNIEAHNLPDPEKFKGTLTVAAKVEIEQQTGLDSELVLSPFGESEVSSSLVFDSKKANGKLKIFPGNVALPFIFQLDDTVPLDQVYVGHGYVSPQDSRFDLFMRDRHGMAWRDVNNDGKSDVFIVRGALKGRISKLPGSFADELLVQNQAGDRFTDQIDSEAMKKTDCPALQTAWVDANGDQKPDIFTLCYKPTTPVQTYPPQLFIQGSNGAYSEQTAAYDLDKDADGSFIWLDLDEDGDMDLFRSTSEEFLLFRNQDGTFAQESLGKNPGGVAKTFDGSNNLTAADYDNDGDLDIFAASTEGNVLLQNNNGTLELAATESLGLPDKSLMAQWVDYDNDGLMDLYSLPQGIHQQVADHQFKANGLLKNQSARGILEARATWFDADNDGDRDLLTAVNFRDPIYRRILVKWLKQDLTANGWFLDHYRNQSENQNHWLELDLKGQWPNPEAIGAQVDIVSDRGTQRQIVGQFEGSHYSQGHYRLYVGLGQQQDPVTLKIRWPDGTAQTERLSQFDQRITLTQTT